MSVSFVSTPWVSSAGRCHRVRCELDPSRSVEPSRHLSATDRQYLAKIKAKFMNARQAAAAARGSDLDVTINGHADEELTPIVPDNLDEMEDILFDRGPENVGQVKMFGGWLDESVAGRKADDEGTTVSDVKDPESDTSVERNRPENVSTDEALKKSDIAFSRAMRLFGRGMYTEAKNLFKEATTLVGAESRLGGQYQLWEAQALDASGEKKAATKLLSKLNSHRDAAVRKVSRELLFIITAPPLQLDPGSFLEIPDIDEAKSPLTDAILWSNFGPLRTALVDKPPEPHTLQWYLDKEPPRKVEDNSKAQALAVAAAIVGTLAFMATSPP